MSTIALNCLIYGDDPDYAFTVRIPLDDHVSTLKEMIKEETQHDPRPQNVGAKNIRLFRLQVPLFPDDASRVSDPLQNDGLQKLEPLAKISAIFDSEDLPTDKVHVMALSPTGERCVLVGHFSPLIGSISPVQAS